MVCFFLQMATFMQDLESSGLLADDEAAAASGADAAAMPNGALAPSSADGSGVDPSAEPQHAAPGDDHTESQTETTASFSGGQATITAERHGEASAGGDAGDSMATEDDAGEVGDGDQAEQRVLGALQGIDGWSEVMDMASRQVRPPL